MNRQELLDRIHFIEERAIPNRQPPKELLQLVDGVLAFVRNIAGSAEPLITKKQIEELLAEFKMKQESHKLGPST
jgi:hypothetical protein